jgi:hypothetical protein
VTLVESWADVDLGNLPSLDVFEDDRQRVLWVLWVAREVHTTPWKTPGEIEVILRDSFGILVPRQRIPGLLAGSGPAAVARRRIRGRFHYQIMQPGIEELSTAPATVTFVDPAHALSHIRQIEGLLNERVGIVHVCDPYVDGRTLDFIAECSNAQEVRLLTTNINKPGPFSRDLKAFRQQHVALPIEVRQAPPAGFTTDTSSTTTPC